MALPTVSGIYAIRNTVNGKRYIGSAINLRARWIVHQRTLKRSDHHSSTLQRAWAKYGPEAFVCDILEIVDDPDNLIDREQHWIDLYRSADKKIGYNVCPTAGSTKGKLASEETRKRLRAAWTPELRASKNNAHWRSLHEARKGKPLPEATRKKISEANRGRRREISEKHKAKLVAKLLAYWQPRWTAAQAAKASLPPVNRRGPSGKRSPSLISEITRENLCLFLSGRRGRILSPEERAAKSQKLSGLRKGQGLGRKASDEARAKMSASRIGRKHTKEAKARMRIAQQARPYESLATWLGKKHSPEAIEKVRQSKLGKPLSAEHKAKLSTARKRFLARTVVELEVGPTSSPLAPTLLL